MCRIPPPINRGRLGVKRARMALPVHAHLRLIRGAAVASLLAVPCGAAAGVPFGDAFRILSHRGSLLGHAGGGSRRAPALFCSQSWQIAARFAAHSSLLAYLCGVAAVFETAAFNRSATSPRGVAHGS